MKRFYISIIFLTCFAVSVFGRQTYLTSFNTRYGTSATVLNQCITCHNSNSGAGSSGLNVYGQVLDNNGVDFLAAESLDSDKDGFTNLREIQARTFPGNAASHPVVVDLPPPSPKNLRIIN